MGLIHPSVRSLEVPSLFFFVFIVSRLHLNPSLWMNLCLSSPWMNGTSIIVRPLELHNKFDKISHWIYNYSCPWLFMFLQWCHTKKTSTKYQNIRMYLRTLTHINIMNPMPLVLNTHRYARTNSWMWAPAALPSWKSSFGLSWCEWDQTKTQKRHVNIFCKLVNIVI